LGIAFAQKGGTTKARIAKRWEYRSVKGFPFSKRQAERGRYVVRFDGGWQESVGIAFADVDVTLVQLA
jgi:hypothetical protein